MRGRMRLILRVLVLAGMAGLGQGLAGVAVMAQTPRLRLRGGGLEALAVDESSPSTLAKQQTEKDPVKRKELFNTVPRMNHKEEWQKWKSDRFPKKSRGPIWRELRDFACGSVVKTRDFLLDNSGLLIYKALPFAIAVLHLPYFKDVTEGMKVFE